MTYLCFEEDTQHSLLNSSSGHICKPILGPKYGIRPLKGTGWETLHHLAVLVLSDLPRGFLTVKACPDSWGEELPLSNIMPVAALCELLCKKESVLPSVRVMHGHSFYFSSGDRLDEETHRNFSFGSRGRQSEHSLCRHLKMPV